MCDRILGLALLSAIVVCVSANAQTPTMTPAGDLEIDSRVDHLPEFPLGPFVATSDGGILGVLENEVLISRDKGVSWEKRAMFAPDQNFKVSSERAMLRTRNGAIVLVFLNMADYLWKWNAEKSLPEPDTRLDVWSVRSLDDGVSWTDAQMIYDGYSGDIHDMIETSDGHLIAPVQILMYDEGRHALFPRYSTDDGKTWRNSNLLDIGGRGHHDGLIEPTLIELKDGRIWMLCRTNLEQFWSVYSDNHGEAWCVWQPSGIPASSAPGQLTRLASGRLLLVWNRPLPEGATEFKKTGGDNQWSSIPVSNHRGELSVAFSNDDGKTWSDPVVIARKPGASLAYPYVYEHTPGECWITTMQGGVRVNLREADFVKD